MTESPVSTAPIIPVAPTKASGDTLQRNIWNYLRNINPSKAKTTNVVAKSLKMSVGEVSTHLGHMVKRQIVHKIKLKSEPEDGSKPILCWHYSTCKASFITSKAHKALKHKTAKALVDTVVAKASTTVKVPEPTLPPTPTPEVGSKVDLDGPIDQPTPIKKPPLNVTLRPSPESEAAAIFAGLSIPVGMALHKMLRESFGG